MKCNLSNWIPSKDKDHNCVTAFVVMPLAHDDESKGFLMEILAEAKVYVLGQENGS